MPFAVAAASQIQAQLESQWTAAASFQFGEARYINVDIPEGQGGQGNAQYHQDQKGQANTAGTHRLLLLTQVP